MVITHKAIKIPTLTIGKNEQTFIKHSDTSHVIITPRENNDSNTVTEQKVDPNSLKGRFRGFYPVVIDVETAGFNAKTDALLEIAAVTLKMNEHGEIEKDKTFHFHVEPFEGANIEKSAIEFNGIDPFNPLRGAIPEKDMVKELCKEIRKGQKAAECNRSVIVAHNATFDHSFFMAAVERHNYKRAPFHPFVTFEIGRAHV